MKLLNTKVLALALGASALANAAFLSPITSGSTTITVNGTAAIVGGNGANTGNAANPGQLTKLTAFGFEVYDVIDAVHDAGAQLGTDTGTFTTNYIGATGNAPPPANYSTASATSIAGLITTSGIFSGVFGNIAWTKTYQFISADVFREIYTVQNNGSSAVANFRGFSAYDPDAFSGSGSPTVLSTNSVGTLSGFNYARAQFTGLNAVLASNNAGLSIGFLPTTNMTGACVNALITGSSVSCNTTVTSPADRAFGYAFNIASLGVGASQSFTVYQLFGNGSFNLTTALAALPGGGSSSSGSGDGVPEPGSMFLMGSACVALGIVARRRAKL